MSAIVADTAPPLQSVRLIMNYTFGAPKNNVFAPAAAPKRPTSSSALERDIAISNFRAGKDQDNLTYCQSLTQRYPEDGFGWKMLAVTLFRQGQPEAALASRLTAPTVQIDTPPARNPRLSSQGQPTGQ